MRIAQGFFWMVMGASLVFGLLCWVPEDPKRSEPVTMEERFFERMLSDCRTEAERVRKRAAIELIFHEELSVMRAADLAGELRVMNASHQTAE